MNYRSDEKGNRYTIFATDRIKRPDQSQIKSEDYCPFCKENIDKENVVSFIGESIDNWRVVSINNKYPIADTHEVIIHSVDHNKTVEKMESDEMGDVFRMYLNRYLALKDKGQVSIFCNFGKFAGASLEHPHSQIIVVDNQVKFDQLAPQSKVENILADGGFNVVVPEYSEYPYEVWIVSNKRFEEFDEVDILTAGKVTQKTIKALITHLSEVSLLQKHFGKPHLHWKESGVAYNYYISTANSFYLRIIPKLTIQAGFELATGINVNVVDPKEVVDLLKQDLQ